MSNYSFIILSFFLFLITIPQIFSKRKSSILKWCKKNNILVSPKITLEKHHFISNDIIIQNETIIEIPYSIFMTPNKYKLLSPKPISDIYKDIFQSSNTSESHSIFRTKTLKDQAFLSLCHLYSIQHKENNNLYSKYKTYFKTFSKELDSFPLLYPNNEIDFFIRQTHFGGQISNAKQSIHLEYEYVKKHYGKHFVYLDEEDYIKYRINSVSKSFNINNVSTVIPMADYFPLEFDDSLQNVHWFYNSTEKVFLIYATKAIEVGQKLLMATVKGPNSNFLMFYGLTFPNNFYMEPMYLNVVHPRWKRDKNITNYLLEDKFDLTSEGFIGDTIESYRQIGMTNYNMKHNDDTGYKMLKINLEYYYEDYLTISDGDYNRYILLKKNRENIKRVIDTEKRLIKLRLDLVSEIVADREARKDL